MHEESRRGGCVGWSVDSGLDGMELGLYEYAGISDRHALRRGKSISDSGLNKEISVLVAA